MPLFKDGVDENSLSLCSHFLELFSFNENNILATGTGFFYEKDETIYLITNAHNITRVNPETGKRISESCAFPIKIRTKIRYMLGIKNENSQAMITTRQIDIELYADDDHNDPSWYYHPSHGYNVDVIALPVFEKNEMPAEIKIFPINRYEFQEDFYIRPSDDVFVIGYPFAIKGGKSTPIWKRGTIATEPGINLDGLPKFLIDTATREGMSGSPVIFKRDGLHSFGTNGRITKDDYLGTIQAFVGIYSGRIGVDKADTDNNFKTQLGVVWKSTVIDEIISAKIYGDITFQQV